MRAFCRLGFGFSFRTASRIELYVCASTSLGVVAITRGRIPNVDLVWFTQGAFDVLLAHAGNNSLIDDCFSALPGADQVSTFVLWLADDSHIAVCECPSRCCSRVGVRHERDSRAGRVGLYFVGRKVLAGCAAHCREGDASVRRFAAMDGCGAYDEWQAKKGDQ